MRTPKNFSAEAGLGEFLERFGLEAEPRLLSDWHARTYEVRREGQPFILRVTAAAHRRAEEILGEVAWMGFLRGRGLCVPEIPASRGGREVETEGDFSAVLFEKLTGRAVAEGDWNGDLFSRWGALVGRLHRFGQGEFGPRRRAEWHASDFLNVEAYLPEELAEVKRAARETIAEVRALESSPELAYGLMHADVYQANFFLAGRTLQLFDFDNCEYGFLVNDIAIALYAALWWLKPGEDREAFAGLFLRNFLEGYRGEFELAEGALRHLPLFLRLRDVLICTVTRKKREVARLTEAQARLLREREERIVGRRAVVAAQF